jgi:hypothetical protein
MLATFSEQAVLRIDVLRLRHSKGEALLIADRRNTITLHSEQRILRER